MTKYYTRQLVDNEGVNMKFLAPEVKLEDIIIESYGDENALTVFIPDNSFFYSIKHAERLSDRLNALDAKASLENGVLTVFVPYNQEKAPRRIEVKEIKAIT